MTTINPETISVLRSRLEAAQSSRWMGGAAIVLYGQEHGTPNGELNAVPGANLTDASYTENPEVITTVEIDEIGDLLEMSDDDLLAFISDIRADNAGEIGG